MRPVIGLSRRRKTVSPFELLRALWLLSAGLSCPPRYLGSYKDITLS
jgi:hypothetical protein